jgi:hypothetical protein
MTDPNPTIRMPVPDEPVADSPVATPSPPSSTQPRPAAAPPSGWVAPSSGRGSRQDGRAGSIVFGVVLLLVGAWFFAEQTLGLDLPAISWGELWPVILIALGAWIVLGSLRRGSR